MNLKVIEAIFYIIILGLIFLSCFIYHKHYLKKVNKVLLICSVVLLVLVIEFSFFIIKGSMKFDSLAEAFNSEISNGKIVEIIEKDDFGLIFYKEGNDTTLHIKTYKKDENDEWLIENNLLQLFNNCQTYSLGNYYSICHFNNDSSNVMVLLIDYYEKENSDVVEMSDSIGSVFVDITEKIGNNNGWKHIYVVLENIDENYYLNIDDEKIYLKQD